LLRVESPESKVQSRESRVESSELKVQSRESRVESPESRVRSREFGVESSELRVSTLSLSCFRRVVGPFSVECSRLAPRVGVHSRSEWTTLGSSAFPNRRSETRKKSKKRTICSINHPPSTINQDAARPLRFHCLASSLRLPA